MESIEASRFEVRPEFGCDEFTQQQSKNPLQALDLQGVPSGAEGSRTLDLCSAIAALSQLSYRPGVLGILELSPKRIKGEGRRRPVVSVVQRKTILWIFSPSICFLEKVVPSLSLCGNIKLPHERDSPRVPTPTLA